MGVQGRGGCGERSQWNEGRCARAHAAIAVASGYGLVVRPEAHGDAHARGALGAEEGFKCVHGFGPSIGLHGARFVDRYEEIDFFDAGLAFGAHANGRSAAFASAEQRPIVGAGAFGLVGVSSDLELNGGGIFDANDVTVLYTPGGSNSPTGLNQVANSQSCGSGWYFDNPVNPTKVTLCPSTCMQIQSDLAAKVEVSIGCPPMYTPVTYTEVYTGQCPQGTKLQWGFFAYSTATPGDSNVVFDAQVSSDGISFSPSVNLAIAKASPNTQVCPMGGPAPCPVNVFNKLGGIPNAQKEYLKLSTTVNPTTSGLSAPTINNWEITYSCPASE